MLQNVKMKLSIITFFSITILLYSYSWANSEFIENACNSFPKNYNYDELQSKKQNSRSPASESSTALGDKSFEQRSLQPIKFKNLADIITTRTVNGKKSIDLDGDGKFEAITYEKKPGTYVLEMDLANTGKPNYFHEYDTDGVSQRSNTWSIDNKTGLRIYEQNCLRDTCETKSIPDKSGQFTKIESQTKIYNKATGLVKISTEVRTWNEIKKQFDISKSTSEINAIQYFVDAEEVVGQNEYKPFSKDKLSEYNKIEYKDQTTQAKSICLDCYGGDLILSEVEKLLKQTIVPLNDNITLASRPFKIFNGAKFYYLNGIYIDEYSCKGLTSKELQLINNDIYEKMDCMLQGAKQLEQTGPAENAIVMKEHLRRLLMTLALKDKKQQPLLGKIRKNYYDCEDECTEYKDMDGPSFTCYTAIKGKRNSITNENKNPGIMYATTKFNESIEYTEKIGDKRRIFYHPHINYNMPTQFAGKQLLYAENNPKKKILDVNLPVFHELMHNCGYDHDVGQCEYAYPCGDLCGRDKRLDQDFLRLCSNPPANRLDKNYLSDIKDYFGDDLGRTGQAFTNSSNGRSDNINKQ